MCSLAGLNAILIQHETVLPYVEIEICPIFVDKAQSPSMMKQEACHDSCQRWNILFKP